MRNETEQPPSPDVAAAEEPGPSRPTTRERLAAGLTGPGSGGRGDAGDVAPPGTADRAGAQAKTAQASDDRPGLGIGLMVFAMATASLNDGLCKLLAAQGLHPVQIAWSRFLCI